MKNQLLPRSNLILIGAGPHYQKKYHNVLEKSGANIALLVDLQSNKELITQYFKDKNLKPYRKIFLEDSFRNKPFTREIDALIKKNVSISSIHGVIITTEPKARKGYALWAIEHGLPIFMDKPISAFTDLSTMNLLNDYDEILQAASNKKLDIVVSSERRAHPGYLWLMDYLKNFIKETEIPITAITIQFSGGVFRTFEEYKSAENHPFKYGYGILLHSGYHYIDLLASFLSLNERELNLGDLDYVVQTLANRPNDLREILKSNNYNKLYQNPNGSDYDRVNSSQLYGETDVLLIGQAKKNDRTITNFGVNLFGTSLSMRKNMNHNLYANLEGRIRQEQVVLHLGHFCSVCINSMPLKKLDSSSYPIEDFTITVMNHPLIQHKKPVIQLDRKKISELYPEIPNNSSVNGYARTWQLNEFLNGRDGNSPFESHRKTVCLLNTIYLQFQKANYQKVLEELEV